MIRLILHPNHELEQSVELESRTILIGRSDENDLTIDDASVASHHARLEKRGEEFVVKDLSKQGILVDGETVREATISVGSIITLGEVDILFKGETAVAYDEDGVLIGEAEPGPEAGALVTTPRGAGRGGEYLPTETFIQPAHIEPERSVASTLPLISFISGALGPLLIGIGWLLGIVLGFVSLANIRRRGGLLKDKRMAVWGINLGFIWVVLVFGFLVWRGWVGGVRGTVARGEASAREVLEDICITEYYARYGYFFDANGNGVPEYASLDQLETLRYSAMPDVDKDLHGYRVTLVRANENGFLCYAEPKAYGRTGRTTYSIDESGLLRGDDLRGASFADHDRQLPPVGQGKSVLETSGEQIANDLVDTAVRVFDAASPKNDKGGLVRARQIMRVVRERFSTSTEAKRRLEALSQEVEPRLAELLADEQYNLADELIEQGEIVRALKVLEAAEARFSTTSYVEKIRAKIALIKEQYFKEQEGAAKLVYAEAQRLELAGQFTEAKQEYLKIKEQYAMTTYGEGIDERIDEVEGKIREQEAAAYIATLRTLRVEKDYVKIVQIVDLLQRSYDETEEYERNYELIELAEQKARAYNEAVQGVRHLRAKDYDNALASFDKAIKAYPDIQTMIASYLEQCYLGAGMKAFERHEYRSALDLFERYRRLPPKENRLGEDYLMRAYFEVGKLDYRQGNFKAAGERLFVCSTRYKQSPEFNYIYGSVLLEQQDNRHAIEYFTRYFEVAQADPRQRFYVPSLRKRGYSQAQLAAELETEVKTLVLANAVYRPLIDATAIEMPETGGGDDETADDDDTDDGGGDSGDDEEEDEDDNRGFGGVVGSLGLGGDVIVRAQATGGDKEEESTPEPAFRKILSLIVEVQKAKGDIAKELRAASGDSARRDEVVIKRSTMVEVFQQRQANLRIEIDRENASKRDILVRISYAAGFLERCNRDLQQVNQRAGRNRELEDVMARLEHKRRMFAGAYANLSAAHAQDLKAQSDAYKLLELAIKDFSGWPGPRDIGRALRDMFMVKPGTEKVAEGLKMLLAAFDVEADLEVILRTGGETDL